MKLSLNLYLIASCVLLGIQRTTYGLEVSYDVVVLAHEVPAGAPPGYLFHNFEPPQINNRGEFAFHSQLWLPASSFIDSIYSGTRNNLSPIVIEGQQATGVEIGLTYLNGSLSKDPVLNDAGQVLFRASLNGANYTRNEGIWRATSGVSELIVREGNQVPNFPDGVSFLRNDFERLRMNNSGNVGFLYQITGPGVPQSTMRTLWSGTPNDLELVARSGTQPVGYPPEAVFHYNAFNSSHLVSLSPTGNFAYGAQIVGSEIPPLNRTAIWFGSPASMSVAVYGGMQAPGFAPGVVISGFPTNIPANGAGQLSFPASLSGPGIDGTNSGSLWRYSSSELSLVARRGDHAPGTPAGVTYSSFSEPLINRLGGVAFWGKVAGTGVTLSNDDALWLGDPANIALVAREGNQAPGLPAGVTFGTFGEPVVNGAGQIAFVSTLAGPGITTSNDKAIWATEPNGLLHLVAREDDWLEATSGNLRRIVALDLFTGSGGEDGRGTSFNDAGQLAFTATFWMPNQYSATVETVIVATIPEPSTGICLLGLANVLFVMRRRPRRIE